MRKTTLIPSFERVATTASIPRQPQSWSWTLAAAGLRSSAGGRLAGLAAGLAVKTVEEELKIKLSDFPISLLKFFVLQLFFF